MGHKNREIKGDRNVKDRKEYLSIHAWLRYHYGSADYCQDRNCEDKSQKFEYALIKGKKYKRDRKCFTMKCKSCHTKYDQTKTGHASMAKKNKINRKRVLATVQGKKKWKAAIKKGLDIRRKQGWKPTVYGEKQWQSKLNNKKVRQIRKLLAEGKLLGKQIAKKFKVNACTITDIKKGRAWKQVN